MAFERTEEGKFGIGSLVKAKSSNTILYTLETYERSPDIYVRQLIPNSLEEAVRLSGINLQQKNYNWWKKK